MVVVGGWLAVVVVVVVVVGGGVIGLEMASVYAAAGTSVTIVEMHDQLAGNLDRDMEKILRSSLKKQGIKLQDFTNPQHGQIEVYRIEWDEPN